MVSYPRLSTSAHEHAFKNVGLEDRIGNWSWILFKRSNLTELMVKSFTRDEIQAFRQEHIQLDIQSYIQETFYTYYPPHVPRTYN
jgi:hypothetical protein